jgi:hypothetical protein
MASTAKNANKNLVSYAGVVRGEGVKSKFFATTVCDIKIPRSMPNKRIPNTTENFSFFLDLMNIKATEEEIANAITLDGVIGAKYRQDLNVVEFVCADEETQKKALATTFEVKDKCRFIAIAPRHLLQRTVLIKIANVSFGEEAQLRQSLYEYWSKYGEIVDIAPHKFPGKSWLTQRWDILLTLPKEEKKLKAPVVFKLDVNGQTLLATWPGAPKSCLKCLTAGHETSKCRGKNPKLGGRPNPEKKDRQVAQAKNGQQKTESEKTPKMGLEDIAQPKPKKMNQIGEETVSKSVSASVSATVSESAPVSASASVMKSVEKSADSGAEGSEMQTDEEDEIIDYAPYYRKGTRPEWISEELWKETMTSLKPEDWERLAAAPANAKFDYAMEEIVESKVIRTDTVTPPPFRFEDPVTPRKGNKRMLKKDNVVTAGNAEFVVNTGVEAVRRSSRKRKSTEKQQNSLTK